MFCNCSAFKKFFYLNPDECFSKACSSKPFDVIIVPGFPADSLSINNILSERIRWACYLFKSGMTKNIIFSGSSVYSPYVEAKAMRIYALNLNLPAENLFIETKAEHTTENVYYSYKIAKQQGFSTIAFATQSFQASFMKPFIKKFKLEIEMLPIVNDSINKYLPWLTPVDIDEAYVPDFVSITEREGKIKRILGTGGRRIKIEIRKERRLNKKQKMN